jgi:hypothetical protein
MKKDAQVINTMRKRKCASSSEIKKLDQNKSSSRCGDRATCFFDLFTSGSTCICHYEVECLSDFANAEDFDFVTDAIDKTLATEGGFVDGGSCVKEIVEFSNVENSDLVAEVVVVEAALWKATVKRHLAAFETDTGAGTGTGFLPFVAFTRRFAVTGAFAATETFDAVL